jgi:hypothetical protein
VLCDGRGSNSSKESEKDCSDGTTKQSHSHVAARNVQIPGLTEISLMEVDNENETLQRSYQNYNMVKTSGRYVLRKGSNTPQSLASFTEVDRYRLLTMKYIY